MADFECDERRLDVREKAESVVEQRLRAAGDRPPHSRLPIHVDKRRFERRRLVARHFRLIEKRPARRRQRHEAQKRPHRAHRGIGTRENAAKKRFV